MEESVIVIDAVASDAAGIKDSDEPPQAAVPSISERIKSEIISSERSYISDMELTMKWFYEPIKDRQLLSDMAIIAIFHHLPTIIEVNRELLARLLDVDNDTVATSFTKLAPYLKLYAGYAKNFQYALDKLQEWLNKDKEFQQFKERQECRPELGGKRLNALLITPIQRIPRYRLLLEDLLNNTPVTDVEYLPLKGALAQISDVANHINEHIRERENLDEMLKIQAALGGKLAPKIVQPGRIFIKQGTLNKVNNSGKASSERHLFLFNDVLLYAKPRTFSLPTTRSRTSGGSRGEVQPLYTCTCLLPLHHCKVEKVLGHGVVTSQCQGVMGGALLAVRCKTDHLLLWSRNAVEIDDWLRVLQETISTLEGNRQTLRKLSSAKQPIHGAKAVVKMTRLSTIRKRRNEEPLEMVMEDMNEAAVDTVHINGDADHQDSLYPMRHEILTGESKRRRVDTDREDVEGSGLLSHVWSAICNAVSTVESSLHVRPYDSPPSGINVPAGPHSPPARSCALM